MTHATSVAPVNMLDDDDYLLLMPSPSPATVLHDKVVNEDYDFLRTSLMRYSPTYWMDWLGNMISDNSPHPTPFGFVNIRISPSDDQYVSLSLIVDNIMKDVTSLVECSVNNKECNVAVQNSDFQKTCNAFLKWMDEMTGILNVDIKCDIKR